MENQELLHWGIKGMKWGVRRYQNKDGTLTPAGKKRYGNDGPDGDKSSASDKSSNPRKKSVSEMSDEELVRAINRARMEDTYRSLRPEEVSSGRKLYETVRDDVVKPAAINAGKRFLEKGLNKITDNTFKDVTDPDSIAGLEKMAKKLELKNKIDKLKNKVDDESWDDKLKKQTWEKNEKNKELDDLERENKVNEAKRKRDESKGTDSDSSSKSGDSDNTSGKKTDDSDDSKVHTGTVFGEGTSKGSQSRKNGEKWWKDADFQDVDYTEVKDSSYTKSGKDYTDDFMDDYNLVLISGLLDDPRKKK